MTEVLKVGNVGGTSFGHNSHIRMRCPGCMHIVSLIGIAQDVSLTIGDIWGEMQVQAGIRYCPNDACRALVFVVFEENELLVSYPREKVDFDASNLPNRILESLQEAIACHSIGSYIAAGIMIRKTLEALCEDRQASGNNLKGKISSLSDIVVLPPELLSGLDDLRLLGNDAAHIDAKTYENIGKEEIEVSLEFAKEVLKATYQYSDLLARLRSLKKEST